MSGKLDQTEEFLGRAFVPIVLASLAVGVVFFVAVDRIGHAYLTAIGLVAMALTTRFTWGKRGSRRYLPTLATLTLGQVLIVVLMGNQASRAPGAAYMALAFLEAVAMTLFVNATVRRINR